MGDNETRRDKVELLEKINHVVKDVEQLKIEVEKLKSERRMGEEEDG